MRVYQRQKQVTLPNIKINNIDLQCIDNFIFFRLTCNRHLGWADQAFKLNI